MIVWPLSCASMGSAREPDPPWYMLAQPTLHKVQQEPVFKLCWSFYFLNICLLHTPPRREGRKESRGGRLLVSRGCHRLGNKHGGNICHRDSLQRGKIIFFRAMLFLRAKGDVVLISINYVRLVCSASDDQNWRGLWPSMIAGSCIARTKSRPHCRARHSSWSWIAWRDATTAITATVTANLIRQPYLPSFQYVCLFDHSMQTLFWESTIDTVAFNPQSCRGPTLGPLTLDFFSYINWILMNDMLTIVHCAVLPLCSPSH